MRTTRASITFDRPFSLTAVDGVQPAGTYTVESSVKNSAARCFRPDAAGGGTPEIGSNLGEALDRASPTPCQLIKKALVALFTRLTHHHPAGSTPCQRAARRGRPRRPKLQKNGAQPEFSCETEYLPGSNSLVGSNACKFFTDDS